MEKDKWIDNKLAAPKDEGEYLVSLSDVFSKDVRMIIAKYKKGCVEWGHDGYGNIGEYVTHWMPLPALPEPPHTN